MEGRTAERAGGALAQPLRRAGGTGSDKRPATPSSRPGGRIPAWAYILIPLLGFVAGLLFRIGADQHDAYLRMYATIGVAVVGLLIARAFTKWQVNHGQAVITAELDLLRERGFRVRPIRWGGPTSRSGKDAQQGGGLAERRRARLLRHPPAGWVLYRPGTDVGFYLTPSPIPHNAGRRKAGRLLNAAAERAERETALLADEMRARKAPWDKWADKEQGRLPDRLVPCLLLLRRQPREHELTEMSELGVRLFSPKTLTSGLTTDA